MAIHFGLLTETFCKSWALRLRIFGAGKIEYKLTETNIAPENRPLEKEIPNLETIILRGENVGFREGRSPKTVLTKVEGTNCK